MKNATWIFLTMTCFLFPALLKAQAEVWFSEAEDFDPKRSVLATNEKGVNVQWFVKEDDKNALGKKYMTVQGAKRDQCQACAPLFYPILSVAESGPHKLWVRSIMPTTGSDSFYWKVSNDGGKTFTPEAEAHGGAQWAEWLWKRPWDGIFLKRGKDNVLVIAERESNPKLDIFCLRNDGKTPTDEEAIAWLKEHKNEVFAVDPRQKLPLIWAHIKR